MTDPVKPAAPAVPPVAPAARPAGKAAEKATHGTQEDLSQGRRRLTWALIWGFLGVNLLMFLRFFFPRVLFEPKTVFPIGSPSDFNLGVDTKFQKDYRIWVIRNPSRIFVVYARCTHLGCTPDWKQSEQKFKCPCHGSGYDIEAVNFEGPAPRPMDRAHVSLDATGQIIVDVGKLYLQDLKAGRDEFDSEGAFLAV